MTNRHIRLITSDLDGTLLDDRKVLTERTKRALSKAIDMGVEFVPATGRPISGVPKDVIDFPGVRYVLTANGARIVDLKENKCLKETLLSYEKGQKIMDIVSEYDCYAEAYYDGVGYGTESQLPELWKYLELPSMRDYILSTRIRVQDIQAYFREKKSATDKVQAFFRTQEDKKEAIERIKNEVEDVEITGALECNIEVGAKGVDKGSGLLMLSKILEIPIEECMAFGDGGNDASMLKNAGIGVAMENGCEETKAAADLIAKNNNEDGVARIIETYVLNE